MSKERINELKFKELIEGIYSSKARFRDLFGNKLEVLDGVKNSDEMFTVKTSDLEVNINEYNTDQNVGFGTGTSKSSRFGELQEYVVTSHAAHYRAPWSLNVGIDEFTVNEEIEVAFADLFEKAGLKLMKTLNKDYSKFISENAGKTSYIAGYSEENIDELFDELYEHFENLELDDSVVLHAKVTPRLYTNIVKHPAASLLKNSSANIDKNTILEFKGFAIESVPQGTFNTPNEICYAYAGGAAKAFVGISGLRRLEQHPDFKGPVLQGAGKYGEYIPEGNKAAVVKVVLGGAPEPITPDQEIAAFEALVVNAENSVELDAQTAQAAYNEAMAYKGTMSAEAKVLASFQTLEQRLIAVFNILYPAAG